MYPTVKSRTIAKPPIQLRLGFDFLMSFPDMQF